MPDLGIVNLYNRPTRDVVWLRVYIACWAVSIFSGVYAFLNRNSRFFELINPSHLSDASSCPLPQHRSRTLLAQRDDKADAFHFGLFFQAASLWIVVSALGSLAVGLGFLILARHHPRALVLTAVALKVAVPLLLALVAFAFLLFPFGAVLLAVAALMALMFRWWWQRVELVIRLMAIAGEGLAANSGLIGVAVLLQGVLVASSLPLTLAGLAAFMNGNVAVNPDRVALRDGTCFNAQQQAVLCCTWQVEPWAWLLISWLPVLSIWTAALIFEIKVFTVTGAVAQWYFTPVAHSALPQAAADPKQRAPLSYTYRSLGWALGPSLGSLCLGSAILTVVNLIRRAMEKTKRESARRGEINILALILVCVGQCVLGLIEYLTKFATVRLAITGEPFYTAAVGAVDLLKRNMMDAYAVWFLPGMILHTCAFLVSVLWSLAISGAAYWVWLLKVDGTSQLSHPLASAAIFGLITLFISWAVLAFLVSITLNVIDAAFFCFAMDRDRQIVTRPEVHSVLGQLPTVGQVVQHPDGNMAYAAPPQHHVMYVPPSK